jgi:hypothetical protein
MEQRTANNALPEQQMPEVCAKQIDVKKNHDYFSIAKMNAKRPMREASPLHERAGVSSRRLINRSKRRSSGNF